MARRRPLKRDRQSEKTANTFSLDLLPPEITNDPIEGVMAEIPDDSNMFLWYIWMEGPPGSP
jgi:hypothetical protein